jgi:chemotaxis protein methyltransferase WspC
VINLECEPWLWNAIVQHLKTKTGLSCEGLGSLNIRRTIAYRMKQTQTRSVASYWFQLQQQGAEWQAFLDEVVVPETSFFRDRVPFQLLTEWAQSQHLTDRKLRILSLPCSTGEEPYSIALTLLGAGLTVDQFEIDAIDLSDRALNIAKSGCYAKKPLGNFWERVSGYWDYQDQTLQMSLAVKRSIDFKLGNVMDLVAHPHPDIDALYDVIFCRNLLIYFDPETRQRVLQGFDRWLGKTGLLFVGHAETGSLLRERWSMFPFPYAFAYQKKMTPTPDYRGLKTKTTQISASKQSKRSASSKVSSKASSKASSKVSSKALPKAASNDSSILENLLKRSRKLADADQLEEALACCEQYLKCQPLCGEGYFLMGQICQAIGALAESDRYLAKAIYLIPNHADALMQLALLREGQGDSAGAEVLRQRLLRSRADL